MARAAMKKAAEQVADNAYNGFSMTAEALDYFEGKLNAMKTPELLAAATKASRPDSAMRETANVSDQFDATSIHELRTSEIQDERRARNLITAIDNALVRIRDREYGFCVDTGEPIGFERLNANPIAIRTLEAEQRHELRKRTFARGQGQRK